MPFSQQNSEHIGVQTVHQKKTNVFTTNSFKQQLLLFSIACNTCLVTYSIVGVPRIPSIPWSSLLPSLFPQGRERGSGWFPDNLPSGELSGSLVMLFPHYPSHSTRALQCCGDSSVDSSHAARSPGESQECLGGSGNSLTLSKNPSLSAYPLACVFFFLSSEAGWYMGWSRVREFPQLVQELGSGCGSMRGDSTEESCPAFQQLSADH